MKEFNSKLEMLTNKSNIYYDYPINEETFIKVGGRSKVFVSPENIEEVKSIVRLCRDYSIKLNVIGKGSNLIISDKGIDGLVLSLKNLNKISIDNDRLIAEGGSSFINLSKFAKDNSLSGLEFACGIPGTVGGAVYMNAGAYGYEIKEILESVLVIDSQGEIKELQKDELELDYRYSRLMKTNDIVIEARFKLEKGTKEDIEKLMNLLTDKRKSSQPLEYPSCGSVFKRPNGDYAARLIQIANLQGYRIGGAEVSLKHSGFIVNIDNASASDYIALINYVRAKVYENSKILLDPEVRIIE